MDLGCPRQQNKMEENPRSLSRSFQALQSLSTFSSSNRIRKRQGMGKMQREVCNVLHPGSQAEWNKHFESDCRL
uniref:Uncharacterized protein n=1 Tax=Knipowitschia caucasica TaxID=637954 RepID=A0AAV2MHE2_KNICA